MYRHILVATDLTDLSKHTLRKAWELASQFEAKLSVVHVIEPLPTYSYPGLVAYQEPLVSDVKKELIEFAKEFGIAEGHLYVEVGPPKTEVVRLAEVLHSDLIVVGSHGRHGIFRMLGSTADAILHNAHCDVLTVRMVEEE